MTVNEKTSNNFFFLCMCVFVEVVTFLEVLKERMTSSSILNLTLLIEDQNGMELLPILYHQLVLHIGK